MPPELFAFCHWRERERDREEGESAGGGWERGLFLPQKHGEKTENPPLQFFQLFLLCFFGKIGEVLNDNLPKLFQFSKIIQVLIFDKGTEDHHAFCIQCQQAYILRETLCMIASCRFNLGFNKWTQYTQFVTLIGHRNTGTLKLKLYFWRKHTFLRQEHRTTP